MNGSRCLKATLKLAMAGLGVGPETQVLTQDLLWRPLGDLRVGDAVWGFDSEPVKPFTEGSGVIRRGQNRARRTKPAVIESLQISLEPAYLLTTQSGRNLTASEHHAFLAYSGEADMRWRTVKSLARPYNGREVPALASWLVPWSGATDFDRGWLSGMFDGEGHVTIRTGKSISPVMGLSQKRGLVLDKATQILRRDSFTASEHPNGGTHRDVVRLDITGGLHEKIRALGLYRPVRLLDKLLKSDCNFEVWLRPDPIVRIESIGMTELIDVTTTSGTCFAEGFATGSTCSS